MIQKKKASLKIIQKTLRVEMRMITMERKPNKKMNFRMLNQAPLTTLTSLL